jgi:hypothetical protein
MLYSERCHNYVCMRVTVCVSVACGGRLLASGVGVLGGRKELRSRMVEEAKAQRYRQRSRAPIKREGLEAQG